jgi:hypothetical protein
MFGFSITKLLFTIATVFVVWNGFKWFNRMQENRATSAGANQGQTKKNDGAAGASNAEEMTKCVTCETYLSSASAVSCGKDGCPYPG